MSELNIFHGLTEIAGQGIYSVLGLRNFKKNAEMVVWMPNSLRYQYDISLGIDKSKLKKRIIPYGFKLLTSFIKSMFRYDVFHFHFAHTFFVGHELSFMRLFRKKLFFEFHGSELRNYAVANEHNPYFTFEQDTAALAKREKKIARLCKKSSGIIIHDMELSFYLPPEYKNVFIVPLRMDVDKFTPSYPDTATEVVKIVHAATNPMLKGTEYVSRAVEKLKEKYNIELTLVQNTTQENALKLYSQADIIVDQFFAGTYGVFALEGMAMGKPVVSYITPEMQAYFPKELPIQSASIDTLYDVLEKLILSPTLRNSLGKQSREYVQNYHDHKKVAKYLYEIYSGSRSPQSSLSSFDAVKNI